MRRTEAQFGISAKDFQDWFQPPQNLLKGCRWAKKSERWLFTPGKKKRKHYLQKLMFSDHPFIKAEIHFFFYRNFLTAPICTATGDEVSMNILLCYSAPPVPKTTAATKVRFPIWCVSSPLTVIPQVSEMFYRVSYHQVGKKHLLWAGNGMLAGTNGESRLDVQSVLPDRIL